MASVVASGHLAARSSVRGIAVAVTLHFNCRNYALFVLLKMRTKTTYRLTLHLTPLPPEWHNQVLHDMRSFYPQRCPCLAALDRSVLPVAPAETHPGRVFVAFALRAPGHMIGAREVCCDGHMRQTLRRVNEIKDP
jgi:hypothetical protein